MASAASLNAGLFVLLPLGLGFLFEKRLTVSLGLLGLMNRVLVWYRRRGPLSPPQLGELLARIFLSGAAPV